jgi:hypothetical protein
MKVLCFRSLSLAVVGGSLGLHLDFAAGANSTTTSTSPLGGCSLNCENDGHCEFVNENGEELQMLVQSGRMIMQCICPIQYTGMGCEQDRPVCDISTLACPNGSPCEVNATDPKTFQCDCSVADTISHTASRFCRQTYTEYCLSANDLSSILVGNGNLEIAFCTNGGKCKADLIAAQVAPGNTTVNSLYEQEGCICPAEFYGPHCEFMHLKPPIVQQYEIPPIANESAVPTETMAPTAADTQNIEDLINGYNNETNTQESTNSDSKSQVLRIILISVLMSIGAICTTLALLTYHRHNQQRAILLRPRPTTPTISISPIFPTASTTSSSTSEHPKEKGSQSKLKKQSNTITSKKNLKKHSTKKTIVLKPTLTVDDPDIVSLSNDPYQHHPLEPFVTCDDDQATYKMDMWNDGSSPPHMRDPLRTNMLPVDGNTTGTSWIQSLWSQRVIHFTDVVRKSGPWHGSSDPVDNKADPNNIYIVDDDDDDDTEYHCDDDRFLDQYCNYPEDENSTNYEITGLP